MSEVFTTQDYLNQLNIEAILIPHQSPPVEVAMQFEKAKLADAVDLFHQANQAIIFDANPDQATILFDRTIFEAPDKIREFMTQLGAPESIVNLYLYSCFAGLLAAAKSRDLTMNITPYLPLWADSALAHLNQFEAQKQLPITKQLVI